MDKQIPEKEKRRRRLIRHAKIGAVPLTAIAVSLIMLSVGGKTVDSAALNFAVAERGVIHSSVTATGKVLPAFEEIIVSPIASRIMDVYCRPGQRVEPGTPLMRLELSAADAQLRKACDQMTMKRLDIDRRKLSGATRLSDLEMQVKVKEMEVIGLEADLSNERYLDSLGSGTGEKVRRAETALSRSRMELSQLKSQISNERREKSAEIHAGEVELSMLMRDTEQLRRTLEDARILSPRRATLTFINNKLGATVNAGEHLATIADLGHFRIEGLVADAFLDRISVGAPVSVKASGAKLSGIVSNIVPASVNGEVMLSVALDNDSCESLRTGMNADIDIYTAILSDVVRIMRFKSFTTPGVYHLYVKKDDSTLERREIRIGASNAEYLEVVSGLKPGEEVVLDDMKAYKSNNILKLK